PPTATPPSTSTSRPGFIVTMSPPAMSSSTSATLALLLRPQDVDGGERDVQRRARCGTDDGVAEELANPIHPVAHRIAVEADPFGHAGSASARVEPCRQRRQQLRPVGQAAELAVDVLAQTRRRERQQQTRDAERLDADV